MRFVIIYLFLEVMVSTTIAGHLGGFLTFMEIIGTAFLGTFILKNFKYSLASNIRELTKGEITQQDFIQRNVGNALGAVLLIIPGFLTDFIGILLQFGVLTMILGKIFSFKPQMQNDNFANNKDFKYSTQGEKYEEEIIDVEVIEHTKPTNN